MNRSCKTAIGLLLTTIMTAGSAQAQDRITTPELLAGLEKATPAQLQRVRSLIAKRLPELMDISRRDCMQQAELRVADIMQGPSFGSNAKRGATFRLYASCVGSDSQVLEVVADRLETGFYQPKRIIVCFDKAVAELERWGDAAVTRPSFVGGMFAACVLAP